MIRSRHHVNSATVCTGYMLNHLDSVIARLNCYMLTDKDFSDFQVIYVTNSNLQPVSAFLLRLNSFRMNQDVKELINVPVANILYVDTGFYPPSDWFPLLTALIVVGALCRIIRLPFYGLYFTSKNYHDLHNQHDHRQRTTSIH